MNWKQKDWDRLEHLKHLLVKTVEKHNYNFRHAEVLHLSRQIDHLVNKMQHNSLYRQTERSANKS
ncbi:MAG: aspartyl-phosphate phosphatase Spo0E family protein [Peptococcaceae bacterium]|nr:aspartyl-phosphate phosphatase Spo0E family protein [Peptococcaceae bacterium]